MAPRNMLTGAVVLLLAAHGAWAQQSSNTHAPGAVMQGDSRNTEAMRRDAAPNQPPLALSAEDRERVRVAVAAQHNDVEFRLKETKPAKDFTPQVGATLPKGLHPDGFPRDLLAHLPQLRDYSYVAMKDQVLIVNAMTRKVVALVPETPQTTGQN